MGGTFKLNCNPYSTQYNARLDFPTNLKIWITDESKLKLLLQFNYKRLKLNLRPFKFVITNI